MTLLYWIVKNEYALAIQIFLTATFLGFHSPISLLFLSLLSMVNYYIYHRLNWPIKIRLFISIFPIFIILLSFKIWGSSNSIFPIGISYYSFKLIHYCIEYYKGKITKTTFLEYLAFYFFLPVILVGPINKFQPFIKEIRKRRFDTNYISAGFERILFGLTKMQIIGNYLITMKLTHVINNLPDNQLWLRTYLNSVKFVLNAYFQFAGFSDVAIGLSLLLGVRICENFNFPFLSTNMKEFWTKYHISLSDFCKENIYTPIASLSRKPILGILVSMLIIATWHELSVRYILWGILQFFGIQYLNLIKINSNFLLRKLCQISTANFFIFSCIIINEETLTAALNIFKILFFIV